jgi:lactate dehydrogenase-like 2-hydroxyacid dehydrogenase
MDLDEVLKQSRSWEADLDVFEIELVGGRTAAPLLNVTAIHHIGSVAGATLTRTTTLATTNLVVALTDQAVPNPVNPEVLDR